MDTDSNKTGHGRSTELWAFLILTVVLAPVLAATIVSGYGFFVWISQMLMGPPGA
jgi:nitrate reductase NapE